MTMAGTSADSARASSPAGPAVELENVGFVYRDGTRALDGVSAMIPVGQRVAIVGQNGSGKSTLVRQLNGLLQPTTGRVRILDRDAAGRHVAELAASVGLAFQNPDRQIFAGRVRREVEFGPRNLGLRDRALDDAVTAALTAAGLADAADANPYDLGFSRRKLLGIASILAMGTPIVVLDEPTTGQDARGVARVEAIVAGLAAAGRTVLAISHDMRFVAECFERVIVLRAGRLVLDGTPAEVFAPEQAEVLASTYLEPPAAARVGAAMGLGSTPTVDSLVSALRSRGASRGEPVGL
jgi:energy-coupling factor transport system ATP-binding protein